MRVFYGITQLLDDTCPSRNLIHKCFVTYRMLGRLVRQ
jgi:hypothetical protein